MKILTTILFSLVAFNLNAQSVHWVTSDETFVQNYILQSATDTNLIWRNVEMVSPLKKDKNEYAIAITDKNIYYRVDAQMPKSHFYSTKIFVGSSLGVDVTNMQISNKVFSWTSQNESNLKYYSMEESVDGINFVETGRIYPKGNSDYKFNLK